MSIGHPSGGARRVREVVERLDANGHAGDISVDRLPERDWNELWTRSVQPFRIGRRVVIRPSRQHAPLQPGDVELIIDPKQAFGRAIMRRPGCWWNGGRGHPGR
ncbi:MAG: 50S ribosomal protein L11 methyltransferase [Nitrospiraceae bacterium]